VIFQVKLLPASWENTLQQTITYAWGKLQETCSRGFIETSSKILLINRTSQVKIFCYKIHYMLYMSIRKSKV
jgi:hypothetical protein